MDERNVLVADALDVVLAITIVQHGRAFNRFDSGDLRAMTLLQVVTRRNRARRSRR